MGDTGCPIEEGTLAAENEDSRVRQLGEYIRLQRQMADLSLRGMAGLTKVSNAYLSQVERGLHQPSLRVLHAIAEALGISADTLLVQAGFSPEAARTEAPAPPPTEQAIRSDPDLTPEEREALVHVYRSFVDRRTPPA
jgi:transcriptional regulator with XRE-family HTH domain